MSNSTSWTGKRSVVRVWCDVITTSCRASSRAIPNRISSSAFVGNGLSVILFSCILIAGCGKSEQDRKAEVASMEPWQMLAKLDGISRDELKSARMRTLVANLAAAYHEPPTGIVDKTYVAQQSLKEKGIGDSSLDILEAMNRASALRRPEDEYAEPVAVYIVLRNSGQSSAEAVDTLNDVNWRLLLRR